MNKITTDVQNADSVWKNQKTCLAPGIMLYENIVSGLEYFRLMSLINDRTMHWTMGIIVKSRDPEENTDSTEGKLNLKIRNCGSIAMPYDRNDTENFIGDQNMIETQQKVHDILLPIFTSIEDDYMIDFGIKKRTWHSRLEILKYDVGQFFENHIDTVPGILRTVSMVMYLNDDYSGGEIVFPRFDLAIKPPKNSMLVFPSNYVYNHSAEKVTAGSKLAVASFMS